MLGKERAKFIAVWNIGPAKGCNADVSKRCLGSKRDVCARQCLKKVSMQIGALLAPVGPPCPTIAPACLEKSLKCFGAYFFHLQLN